MNPEKGTVSVRRIDPTTRLSRSLKTLVPLIKEDLRLATQAGLEYYRRAGDKLRECRKQVAPHRWQAWLTKNFELSRTTAWRYMRLSEKVEDGSVHHGEQGGLRELTEQSVSRERSQRDATREYRHAIRDADVKDMFIPPRDNTREEETQAHRKLALELIDIGYKALATRLHPDHAGGSRIAMRRLNRVRDELKSVAETRRFE
jgi:hypothetical protein